MTDTTIQQTPERSALLNADLAPTAEGKATWRSWDLFCLWMTSAHSLGSYTFAIGMLALGLSGWQTMLALFVGVLGLWLGSNLIGVAGQKVGVPFPVFARATFGIFGANIPALLRGLVAVFWYGIQTYLASLAVIVLIVRIWPGMESWTTGGFLGQSPLGWITFMVLWAVQLLVLSYGMEIVRKASDFAGPVVWIGMIALAIWMLEQADWSINWHARVGDVLSLPSTIAAFVAVAFLMIATWPARWSTTPTSHGSRRRRRRSNAATPGHPTQRDGIRGALDHHLLVLAQGVRRRHARPGGAGVQDRLERRRGDRRGVVRDRHRGHQHRAELRLAVL